MQHLGIPFLLKMQHEVLFFSPHFIDDTLNTRAECVRDSLICRKYMFLAKIFALWSMGIQLVPSPLQFGDKCEGQKFELWIYTGVIRQRSSYYYIIWVSGCCSRFLVLLNWNKSASEIHLNYFTCYSICIQYASQYRIPILRYGFARRYSPLLPYQFRHIFSVLRYTPVTHIPWLTDRFTLLSVTINTLFSP